ncbi:MAG TPA: 1-deoxy-D-xylulose-5-phosphate synthase [Ruminiclostridium sp.]|nr:1-deoxy-D-xylulose-5-phosphate synthase [Ruminiclostridium sp.]
MGSVKLLDSINSPNDLKKLNIKELENLCEEIRQELIETVSNNGGHLASNLGVVELTVAIHYVFDSPEDQIVWDVGHQCYTHKLLTGRREEFKTIRKFGGISGFTKPRESEHDPFGAGHSSTSISAASGLAKAKTLKNENGSVIAVIGDGALSGGLAYEGLNNAGRSHDKLIIILNDNKMFISRNVGAMARHLTLIRTKPWYFRVKDNVEKVLQHTPLIGSSIRTALVRSKSFIKNALYHSTIFEDMGLLYLGPVDGHNLGQTIRVLERAKSLKKPVLVHTLTTKGKGYTFAENNPGLYHGVSKFDVETGDPIGPPHSETYSEIFGNSLCLYAKADNDICAVTAAMTDGTGLAGFASKYKDRFFDVGIAEEHAVVFAAGLARNGMKPVFAVYSTFLQRAYDQIIHDAALQNLNVVLAIDRAGITGEDGETHQGIYDVALMSNIPGIIIYSPSTKSELQNNLYTALYECSGPVAVRYPRGTPEDEPQNFHSAYKSFDYISDGNDADVILVTYGRLFSQAIQAAKELKAKDINAAILKLNRIFPIDDNCYDCIKDCKRIIFFEEGIKTGGIGEHFGIRLFENGYDGKYIINAIDNKFVKQGTVKQLLSVLGLDSDGMVKSAIRECES